MADQTVDIVQLLCDLSEAFDATFRVDRLGGTREIGVRVLAKVGVVQPGARPETVVCRACDEDHPATVEFDASKGRYVCFCREAGFVAVDDDDLATFRFDPNWIVDWLAGALSVSSPTRRHALVPGRVWHLGDAAYGDAPATVIFARLVSNQAALDLLVSALRPVHPANRGLVITTSPYAARRFQLPNGYEFLDLRDIGRSVGDQLIVDRSTLGSRLQRLQGHPLPVKRPVRTSRNTPKEPNRLDWREADKPLIAQMHAMIRDERARNPTDAARALARRAPGNGKEASKVTRLATAYIKLYPSD